MKFDIEVRPNIIPWPPMIYAAAAISAYVAGRLAPFAFVRDHAVGMTGAAVLFAGVLLDCWAMATMWRRKTNILPHRGADELITSGPFHFTRNPIYLGNTVAMMGLSVYLDNGWFALFGFGAAIAVDRLAICREEAATSRRVSKKRSPPIRRRRRAGYFGIGDLRRKIWGIRRDSSEAGIFRAADGLGDLANFNYESVFPQMIQRD